jgi:hypothetical protein
MAPAFNRLFHRGRRRPEPDRPPARQVTVDIDALPLEGATVGTVPTLVPAAIFYQTLFDPTEFTPAWLQSRPAVATETPEPSDPADDQPTVAVSGSGDTPKTAKRARQPKTSASPAASRPRSKRIAKPDHGGARD